MECGYKLVDKIIGLLFYLLELGISIYVASQHFSNGDYWWGGSTVFFITLPMIISSIWLMIPGMCFLYIGWLVLDVISSIRGNDYIDPEGALSMKLCVALLGSYPQAALQMYIVFQELHIGNEIVASQWLIIFICLTTLSFTFSYCQYFYGNLYKAATISRVIFFIFGLLAVTSRLMVGCVFSMRHGPLWIIPICTEMAASIIMWSIVRWSHCSLFVPLAKYPHHGKDIDDIVNVVITWLLTAAYNSFTLPGLVVSIVNIAFAIGGFFMDASLLIAIASFSFAIVSCAANAMVTATPCFKIIKEDWLRIDDDGDSEFY